MMLKLVAVMLVLLAWVKSTELPRLKLAPVALILPRLEIWLLERVKLVSPEVLLTVNKPVINVPALWEILPPGINETLLAVTS